MSVIEAWSQRARERPRRIVLADRGDPRAAEAADLLAAEGLVEPILVGRHVGSLQDISDPQVQLATQEFVAERETRGKVVDLTDPLVMGALLVRSGWAAGCVAGASRSSADVIRAGVQVLGTSPGVDVVSGSFFLVLADGRAIIYGDCGVVPDPSPDELASIAISTALTFEQLSGEQACVAMLSYSTKGSAAHARVDKVRAATDEVRRRAPDLLVDGELQFDAAWVPEVAATKAPDSAVAGHANVFIFPDLDSGNIAYKITERLAGARAFGPLLQGLGGVMHDLSRGCSVQDITTVAVIAAVQAPDVGGSN